MKNAIKIISWLIFVVGILLFVEFLIIAIKKNEFNEYFTMILSALSIFATFGGAYLGAKISGDNAIHIMKKQLYIQKVDNLVSVQSEILFNMNYLWNFLIKAYGSLGFNLKLVKKN